MNDLMLGVAQALLLVSGRARAPRRAGGEPEAGRRRTTRRPSERHRAGVATIADVLQARTSLSQQTPRLRHGERPDRDVPRPARDGARRARRPARRRGRRCPRTCTRTRSVAVRGPPHRGGREASGPTSRPRAPARTPRTRHVHVRPLGGPARRSRPRRFGGPRLLRLPRRQPFRTTTNYSLGLFLRVPGLHRLQDGLRHAERRGARRARPTPSAETFAQQVIFQVWNSYFGVQTAAQQVRASQRPPRERAGSPRRSRAAATARASGASSTSSPPRAPSRPRSRRT